MTKIEILEELNPAEVAVQRAELLNHIEQLTAIAGDAPHHAQKLAQIASKLFGVYKTYNVLLDAIESEG